MELLTAAQMRAIETAAMDSGAVTGLDLMESAGQALVAAMRDLWPDLRPGRAVVLCGPGNNGGDGFVIARSLCEQGWRIELYLYGDETKLPPDAKRQCQRWRRMGQIDDIQTLYDRHGPRAAAGLCVGSEPMLFVDALFGTGLVRPVEEAMAGFLADVRNHSVGTCVAVDIASGHCADSGRVLGGHRGLEQARAYDLTVTFHRPKTGHVTQQGAAASGVLRVVEIGLEKLRGDAARDASAGTGAARVAQWIGNAGPSDSGRCVSFEDFAKSAQAHKYDHGHALVLSGPAGRGGAARLAARAALRVGAGLVTVGCGPGAVPEHAARLDAIMIATVEAATGLTEALADTRINALCLGPGLGLGSETRDLVTAAMEARRATVLDADALSVFQPDPGALFAALHAACVLTPHAGEFRRLFPDLAVRLGAVARTGPAYSKLDATREAAARAGCVVLFKGADTVVADPEGQVGVVPALYERQAPWLATAGAGDVLAGIITGLLARGQSPRHAAENGAWLHIAAARAFGPGLIAEDLPEMIPQVFRSLGAG
jgi:hydroxyethylthiazole kinase-like uncharacterized protein yjeF